MYLEFEPCEKLVLGMNLKDKDNNIYIIINIIKSPSIFKIEILQQELEILENQNEVLK